MTNYVVCCTDRGQHGRVQIRELTLDLDAITERMAREAATPWDHGATLEAEGESFPLAPRTIARIESARSDYEGQEQWRFPCKKCGRDRRLSGDHLRAWMAAVDGESLDISLLPR